MNWLEKLPRRTWRRSVVAGGILLLILSIIGMFLPVMPGGGTPASYIGTLTTGTLTTTTLNGPTGRGATVTVATADATATEIAQADYKCDATADEVQLAAAQTAGKHIGLSQGSLHITTQLDIASNTLWSGAGIDKTFIYVDVSAGLLAWYKHDIAMRDLTIISTSAQACWTAYSNHNNLFERVRFVSNKNTYNGIVQDIGSESGVVNGYNNRYLNCIFERTGTGATTTLYFNNSDDSSVTNCTFIGLAGESSILYVFGDGTEVSGNTFHYTTVSLQDSTGASVLNNHIYDACEMGIGGTGLVINPSVIGNHIERSSENGIDLGGAYGALIQDNTVLASGLFHTGGVPSEGFGICCWAVNSVCIGNYAAFSYKDGIMAGGASDTKLSFIGNVSENNGLGGESGLGWGTGSYIYGIRVYAGTDNVVISGNRLLDTQLVGSSLLAAQANAGQKSITVADASIFKRYQAITVSDSTPQSENAIISTINTTTDTITVVANLTNTYTMAKTPSVTGLRTGGGLHLEAGIANLVCEGNDLSNNLGNDIGASLTGVVNNTGYIHPGEVREYAITITAGVENTVTAWQNPFAQNVWVKEIYSNITVEASATEPNYDMGIDGDGAGAPDGAAFYTDLADNVGTVWSWANSYGGTATGVQTALTQLSSNAGANDWIVLIIDDAAGADTTGKLFITLVGQ